MKTRIAALLVAGAIVLAQTLPVQASIYTLPPGNLVQNGGFEQGLTVWGYTYNWGVAFGYPSAAEGSNFADIYGTIYQTLATVPGQEYQLEFAISGNFNIASGEVLNALWGSDTVATATWNPAGHNVNNFGWVFTTVDVTATSSSTVLTFSDPFVGDGTQRIVNIDAVSVIAVPEPSSAFLIGLGGIVFLWRRPALKSRQNLPRF